jgi:hypothetical protein
MSLQRFCFVALCIGLLEAQTKPAAPASPAATPPPGVEEALRERVRTFYEGYVDQKMRKSYDIVADDSKDAFLTAPRFQYSKFEIEKMAFSDDYTTAVVTTVIHPVLNFFGIVPPGTPEQSYWKNVDGEWYWYVPPPAPGQANLSPMQRLMMAMFNIPVPGANSTPASAPVPPASLSAAAAGSGPGTGVSPAVPVGMPAGMPGMMPGMMPGAMPGGFPGGFPGGLPGGLPSAGGQSKAEAAKLIRLERDEVEFSLDKPGSVVLSLSNAARGEIHFAVVLQPVPGLAISPVASSVAPGRSTGITISWTPPAGKSAVKNSAPPAEVLARVSVVPAGLLLPLTIHFR